MYKESINNLQLHIGRSLLEIEDALLEQKDSIQYKHPGLLAGSAGILLFYAYSYSYNRKESYLEKMQELIVSSLEFIEQNKVSLSLENGIAGIGWALQHFSNIGVIRTEESIMEQFDYIVQASIEKDVRIKRYDYFTGLIGKGVYFLERHESKDQLKNLELVLDKIESFSVHDPYGTSWCDFYVIDRGQPENLAFNFGLSHGIPSILMFLLFLHKKELFKERVVKLLKDSLKWVLSFKLSNSKGEEFFPVRMINYDDLYPDEKPAKLAWCFGDLGSCYALYQIAIVLGDEAAKKEILRILIQLSKRNTFKEAQIVDAGLCHGSAGIALIFKMLYEQSGHPLFQESHLNWVQQTLDFGKITDGVAGFKAYHGQENGGWVNDIGFLEGISGIGLLLLHIINKDTSISHHSWTRLLLLN
jgi:lantibiotic modifying enzyme